MRAGRDREALRSVFVQAWGKRRAGLVLEALEALEALESLVTEVIGAHPEYHDSLMR